MDFNFEYVKWSISPCSVDNISSVLLFFLLFLIYVSFLFNLCLFSRLFLFYFMFYVSVLLCYVFNFCPVFICVLYCTLYLLCFVLWSFLLLVSVFLCSSVPATCFTLLLNSHFYIFYVSVCIQYMFLALFFHLYVILLSWHLVLSASILSLFLFNAPV